MRSPRYVVEERCGGEHEITPICCGGAHEITPICCGGAHEITPICCGGVHKITPICCGGAHEITPIYCGGAHKITPICCGVCVFQYYYSIQCFIDLVLPLCPCSLGYYSVCSSSIYEY